MPARIDRFRIEHELGRGAFSIVYRAFDPQLQRAVALKLIAAAQRPAGFDERCTIDLRKPASAALAEEALVEARVMARLSHPNVLPVFEVGVDAAGVFFVLELVAGQNLRTWLATPPRAHAEIIEVLGQAARGLAAAHAAEVVHRDFKPDNVLVGDDGRVRVADFGLSGLFERPQARAMTRVGGLQGTPRYMAPELWNGAAASCASDVYALALTCGEALAGDVPADELDAALAARDVTPALRAAIRAGLADDPALRPTAAAFVAVLAGRGVRTRRRQVIAAATLAAGIAAGTLAAVAMPSGPSCTADDTRFTGWWSGGAALTSALAHRGVAGDQAAALGDKVERLIGAESSLRAAVCTDPERVSCLDRRLFELRARIDKALDPLTDDVELPLATASIDIASCATVRGTAIASAMLEQARYAAWASTLDKRARGAGLEPLAETAAAAGNPELGVLALRRAASLAMARKDMAAHDRLLARAFTFAEAAHADGWAVQVLAERAHGNQYRDVHAAHMLIGLAVERVERAAVGDQPHFKALAIAQEIADAEADWPTAIRRGREALAFAEHQHLDLGDRRDPIEIERRLGNELEHTGKLDEAMQMASRAVADARASLGGSDATLRATLDDTGMLFDRAGRTTEAADLRRQLIAAYQQMPIASPADAARVQYELGRVYSRDGKFEEARAAFVKALDGAGPELAFGLQFNLARTLAQLHRNDEARVAYEGVIRRAIAEHGEHHPTTLYIMLDAALVDLDRKDTGRAEREGERLAAEYGALHDVEMRAAVDGGLRAMVALARNHPADAERFARAANDALRVAGRPPQAHTYDTLAQALLAEHRYADAIDTARTALDAEHHEILTNHASDASLLFTIAKAELALGHRANALAAARDAVAKASSAGDHSELTAWLEAHSAASRSSSSKTSARRR